MKKLIDLRSELSVPKNHFNAFGKYNYRNQEDILEAVKPLLKKYGLLLTITDTVVEVCGRVYVEARVQIKDGEEIVTAQGFAREPENKKGMDESQITGTASSYARKYALNALFLIDDTKDADSQAPPEEKKQPPFKSVDAIIKIDALMTKLGCSEEYINEIQHQYSKAKTREDFTAIYKAVEGEN